MISTQYINSINSIPKPLEDYEAINVLKWNNSVWKNLCPYILKTDGNEKCSNPGNVIFENFYQGCKVYDVVHKIMCYPSAYQRGNPKYLQWEFTPVNPDGDNLVKNGELDYDLYFRWRNSLWNCKNPIRYPNGFSRRINTQFALLLNDHEEERLDYISTRKKIYVEEYIRLVKNLSEYNKLLQYLIDGKNIMICEIDVPKNNKRGEYGKDCDENNICRMSIEKLETLLNDTSEPFGHGLCLAYSLLKDVEKLKEQL